MTKWQKLRYRIVPKYYGGKRSTGARWSSFRWFGTGWDSTRYGKGDWFVQFGRDPVKFIVIIPKGKEFPDFLLTFGWKTTFCKGRVRAGTTIRPRNYKLLWGRNGNRYTTTVGTKRRLDRSHV